MNRFTVLLLALFVAAVAAEAPYAASGWRPEGAQFRLPTQYAAPLVVFQPQPRVVELQFTRENVQFAGRQIAVEQQQQPTVTTTAAPTTTTSFTTRQFNENVPVAPSTTTVQPDLDPVNVQALPAEQSKKFQQQVKQNARLRQQAPRPFFPLSGQLRALPGVPSTFFQQQVAALPQIPQQQQPQQVPAESYGPPQPEEEQPQQQPEEEETPSTTTVQPPSDNDDDAAAEDEYEDDAGRTVVAIANGFSGQYYILSPDNTLQRVVYSATQTDEDRLVNGFSAQLKYAPVEPIRGPVYTYNEQGQLVRIYKK